VKGFSLLLFLRVIKPGFIYGTSIGPGLLTLASGVVVQLVNQSLTLFSALVKYSVIGGIRNILVCNRGVCLELPLV